MPLCWVHIHDTPHSLGNLENRPHIISTGTIGGKVLYHMYCGGGTFTVQKIFSRQYFVMMVAVA